MSQVSKLMNEIIWAGLIIQDSPYEHAKEDGNALTVCGMNYEEWSFVERDTMPKCPVCLDAIYQNAMKRIK